MLSAKIISNHVRDALCEDQASCDITTKLTMPDTITGTAKIIAKEQCILCGIDTAKETFKQINSSVIFRACKKDGQLVKKGENIALIKGDMRSILTSERIALNFLSLLSGISTLTGKFVEKTKKTKLKIMDTRKTTPSLRCLSKYAVKTGGGFNHRMSLAEGILIKDNHLKAGGYITCGKVNEKKIKNLITRLRQKTSLKIEVEVENLTEYYAIIKYKPDIILLDNFSIHSIKSAIKMRNKNFPNVKIEVSGRINLKNIEKVSTTGVDYISIGMLTHSPKSIDFSLEI